LDTEVGKELEMVGSWRGSGEELELELKLETESDLLGVFSEL